MEGTWTADGIYAGGDARQRYHDARGYGVPADDGGILLKPVEAAHLLYRDDLDSVDGDDFAQFLSTVTQQSFLTEFVVYQDLRARGFYLRPLEDTDRHTFAVFERGSGPTEGQIAYHINVIDERAEMTAGDLTEGVLAVVDEEAEVGYIGIEQTRPEGGARSEPSGPITGALVGKRVVIWDPPSELYTDHFYGQPISGRDAFDDVLQLSIVEARYLVERGILEIDVPSERLLEVGRSLEGHQFDRRFTAYRFLRESGAVPKTGYKFGADFRVYRSFNSLDDMGHSALLIRVIEPDAIVRPQALALDVRLAHGVGKRMVFARSEANDDRSIDWLSIERVTP